MKLRIDSEGSSREVDLYSEEGFRLVAELWTKVSCEKKIMYEPSWLGVPIIQYPGDIVMMQELIWKIRPDTIIETGVAHGGSAVLYASILELIGKGSVIGVDIEIRKYNRVAIEGHPMSKRIRLIEGSSVDQKVADEVARSVNNSETRLVVLDSNHSYDHVMREMELYGPLVTPGSYMVVMDGAQGLVWDIPSGKEEWREDNPLRAIKKFVADAKGWEIDNHYNRLRITSNPSGFLRRIDDGR